MYRTVAALALAFASTACIAQGPDHQLYLTESTRITYLGGVPMETPFTCTAADYTVQCPFTAYTQRLEVEPIRTDPMQRWAVTFWAPALIDGIGSEEPSLGAIDASGCLDLMEESDNTGLRGQSRLCASQDADGFVHWATTMEWTLRAVAGHARFSWVTGASYGYSADTLPDGIKLPQLPDGWRLPNN